MDVAKHSGMALAALFAVGTGVALLTTYMSCEKTNLGESALQGILFAVVPSSVPLLSHYVPRVTQPFENVLRDTFGVAPEKAPMLGQAYLMMLLAWVMIARLVGSISKSVCIPTPDEVAQFKARFQKKQAKKDADEAKKSETLPSTA